MNIADIRKKFPEYKNVSDGDLADALYEKYYMEDMSRDDFYSQINLKPQPLANPYAQIEQPEQPKQTVPLRPGETQPKFESVGLAQQWRDFNDAFNKLAIEYGPGLFTTVGATIKGAYDAFSSDAKYGSQEFAKIAEESTAKANEAMLKKITPKLTPNGQLLYDYLAEKSGDVMMAMMSNPNHINEGGGHYLADATNKVLTKSPEVYTTAKNAGKKTIQTVKQAMQPKPEFTPEQVAQTQRRQEAATNLPEPIQLTKGQATNAFEQQQFEQTAAKTVSGDELRRNAEIQNMQLQNNLDMLIDDVGAKVTEPQATGGTVRETIIQHKINEAKKVQESYTKAMESEEGNSPVILNDTINYLNENKTIATDIPVLKIMSQKAIDYGVAMKDAQGNLIPLETTLNKAEDFRKSISSNTQQTDNRDIFHSSQLKNNFTVDTETAGGDLYANARSKYTEFKNKFEKQQIIKDILSNKTSSNDKMIATENIFKRSILGGTAQDIANLKKTLLYAGDEGKSAWQNLQGTLLRYIKEEATKNVARDTAGNPIFSAARINQIVKDLEHGGRLEILLGKDGADVVRTVNDVAKHVLVSPPGTVNYSNTAPILAAMLDVGASAFSGVPAPIASVGRYVWQSIKDKKLQARIQKSLNFSPKTESTYKKPSFGIKETAKEQVNVKPTKEEVKAKVEAKKEEKEGKKKVNTEQQEARDLHKEVKNNQYLETYKDLILDEGKAITKGERNQSHNWFDVPVEDDFGQTVATKRIAGQRDITEAFTADSAAINRFMNGKATVEDLRAINHDLKTFEMSADLRDEAAMKNANKTNESVELSDGSIYDPFSKMTYSKKEWQDLMNEAMFSKNKPNEKPVEWHNNKIYLGDSEAGITFKTKDAEGTSLSQKDTKGSTVYLNHIISKNKGDGTVILNAIKEKYPNRTIETTVSNMFGTDTKDLVKFYEKNGFVEVGRDNIGNVEMKYNPTKPNERLNEWHKDSAPETKNEDGSPKVFYHGTNKSFDEFQDSKIGDSHGAQFGKGHYFTDNPSKSDMYATGSGANTMPVYLKIKNIADFDNMSKAEMKKFKDVLSKVIDENQDAGYGAVRKIDITDMPKAEQYKLHDELIEKTDKYWHDRAKVKVTKEDGRYYLTYMEANLDNATPRDILGLIMHKQMTGLARGLGFDGIKVGDEYVVFNPNQIKSIHNKGTFSESNPNILFSKGIDDKDLIVQHNLSEKNLEYSKNTDGIVVPSLGITKKDTPLTGFGEITLLGDKELANPKGSAKTKVFGADIYSPRFPKEKKEYKLSDIRKIDKELEKYTKEIKEGSIYNDEGIANIYDNKAMQMKFLEEEKGITFDIPMKKTQYSDMERPDSYALKDKLRPEIEKYADEYQSYINNFLSDYEHKSFFYKDGKKVKFNTDSIIKHLTSNLRGGENWNYGTGSLRAKVTPEFKSIEEIRKNKDKIVSKKDFESVKEEITNELFDIAEKLKPHYKYQTNSFGYTDEVINALGGQNTFNSLAKFGFTNITSELKQQIADFMGKLKNMPTEYFEGKITRTVKPSEFHTAVVPDTVKPETIKYLEEQGLNIKKYKKGDEADRARAIKEAAEENDLLFSQFKTKNATTKAEAQNIAKDLLGKHYAKHADTFEIVQSIDDLPQNIKDALYSIQAYHGTPHNVDKFSTKYIGTGEGAQAYGYGMYFAGDKQIADWYRNSLSDVKYYSKGRELSHNEAWAAQFLHKFDSDMKAKRISLEEAISHIDKTLKDSDTANQIKEYAKQLDKDGVTTKQGNLYKVELKPKQEELLDWDKPLSEQSDYVKEKLEREKKNRNIAYADSWDGAGLYGKLEEWYKTPKQASDYLNSLGIKGIKYLDATSRSKQEGSHNYVIFADEDIGKPEVLKSGGKPRGIFDPKTGKAYIIADAMKSNEVEGVILHELLHKNINNEVKAGKSRAEAIMGSRYESVVKRLDNLYKMGDKQVKEAFQKVTDANTPAQHRIEEVMTYLLENITNESKPLLIKWKDDVIQAIKAFIAKVSLQLGMKAETVMSKLDSKDIANILRSEAIKNESMLKNIKR